MSMSSALGRIYELQQRFAGMTPINYSYSIGFEETLQTAQSQFTDGPERLDGSGSGSGSGSASASFLGLSKVGRTAGRSVNDTMIPAAQKAAFNRYSQMYNVPVALAQAVGRAESNFNPDAKSTAGAIGVMQLMPATARGLGVKNPRNYEENIRGGIKYLSQMLDRYNNDVTLALAAYNAGPTSVDRAGGLPDYPETRSYVSRVTDYARQFGLSL